MAIGAQAARVEDVSETPLAGTDLQVNPIAAPVQRATATDIENYTAAWLANTQLTAQGAVQSLPFHPYTAGPQAGNALAQSATFFAPGAPRRAWVELRIKF